MEKKRVAYFDVMNILAALAVIFLHCNGISHTYSDTLAWKQALIVEVGFYWAVPIFMMLSGANLMNYREKYSTKAFFKKRFLKTVIPLIVWTLVVTAEKRIRITEIGEKEFINRFMSASIEPVYWFFFPLFAVYLSMPVLSLLKDQHKTLWYMAGGALVLNTLLPSICKYLGLSWNSYLTMLTAGGYLIYPIIGYLFSITDFKKYQRGIIYALGLISTVGKYVITYWLSTRDGALNQLLFGYTTYIAVFQACAVFIFFKYFPLCQKMATSAKVCKVLQTVSGCSFGIYLTHMIIYRRLDNYLPTNCWEWRLLVPFLIYAIAFAITFVIKKIPVLKNIVP